MSAVGRSAAAKAAEVKSSQQSQKPELFVLHRVRRYSIRGLQIAGPLVLLMMLLAAVMHYGIVSNALELQQMRSEISSARVTNNDLRLRLARLQAPARITEEAFKLGMKEPDRVTYIDLGDGPLSNMEISIVSNELQSGP